MSTKLEKLGDVENNLKSEQADHGRTYNELTDLKKEIEPLRCLPESLKQRNGELADKKVELNSLDVKLSKLMVEV
jgi:hypothetical protein